MSRILLVAPKEGLGAYAHAFSYLREHFDIDVANGADEGKAKALTGDYTTVIMGYLGGKYEGLAEVIEARKDLRQTTLVALEPDKNALREMFDSHLFDITADIAPPAPQHTQPLYNFPNSQPRIDQATIVSPEKHFRNLASNIQGWESTKAETRSSNIIDR